MLSPGLLRLDDNKTGFCRQAQFQIQGSLNYGRSFPMADMNITQAEADALIAMPKIRTSDETWNYPSMGGAISIPLISPDKRENFLLDIRKGRINLSKGSYQNRSRQVIVLVRIDFGGSVHRNPDGTEVLCPHLHL
jgi:hypothetical protein